MAGAAPYAQGIDPVTPDDPASLAAVDQLRLALEAVVGQRITFRGEARERSGVRAVQRIDELDGDAVGIDAGSIQGRAESEQDIRKAKGTVTGIRAERIGP